MFGDQPLNYTLVAATDVSRYHIVIASGANYGGLSISTSNATVVGVAQNQPLAGEHLAVCPLGISRVYCGSAVAIGGRITSNISGRAIAAGSGDFVIGYALEAGVAGDLIRTMVMASADKTSS